MSSSKRLTSARKIILETLEANPVHLSAYDIYERVKLRLPSVNLSTVYRSLEYLVKTGLASVSDIGAVTPVYQAVAGQNHHHLVCQNCGTTFELPHATVDLFFQEVSRKNEFAIQTNHLILFGLCKQCK